MPLCPCPSPLCSPQTIKEITDLVRQSVSTTPSSTSSPGQPDGLPMLPGASGLASQGGLSAVAGPAPGPYATETEGESRRARRRGHVWLCQHAPARLAPHAFPQLLLAPPLHPHTTDSRPSPAPIRPPPRLRDYLGSRPEQADPLERVLEPLPLPEDLLESTPQRVLRALENAPASSLDPDSQPPSAPASDRKAAPPPPPRSAAQRPLSQSLTAAVRTLAVGSPHQANGVAQYMATRASTDGVPLRASRHKLPGAAAPPASSHKLRSSFLQRPPAAAADLFSC